MKETAPPLPPCIHLHDSGAQLLAHLRRRQHAEAEEEKVAQYEAQDETAHEVGVDLQVA